MRPISVQEFRKSPPLVRTLYTMCMCNVPVSPTMMDEAIEKHPYYFPDEIKAREEWDSISLETHEKFNKELSEAHETIFKDTKPVGFISQAEGNITPEDMEAFNKATERFYEAFRDLSIKHYGKVL